MTMLHTRLYLLLALITCFGPLLRAQVGIGTTTPNAQSILHLNAADKALLLPITGLATPVLTPANTPTAGMLMYSTNLNQVLYYDGTGWLALASGAAGGAADRQLNNLNANTNINSTLRPATTGTIGLGTAARQWLDVYASGAVNFSGLGAGVAAVANDRVIVGSNTNGTLKALTNGAVGEVLVVGVGNVLGWTSPRLNSVSYGTATAQNSLTNTGQYLFNVEYGAVAAGLLGARVSAVTTAGATTALTVNAGGTTTVTGLSVSASGGTNNYAAVFASGNVGIGTSFPATSLHINATDAVIMPVGTTAQRPGTPANGMLRYNSTLAVFEGYNGAWTPLGGGGLTLPYTQSTANAGTLFDLTNTGTGGAGRFAINNAANTTDALTVVTNGTGNTLSAQQTGTAGRAGNFAVTNGANTSIALFTQHANPNGIALQTDGRLDVRGTYGFWDATVSTLVATNNDLNLGIFGFARITTTAVPFSITGLASTAQGKIYRLYNNTTQPMTIAHENAGSAAANRIRTSTGADVVVPAEGVVTLQYAAGLSRWIVVNTQGVSAGGGLTLPVNQADAANANSFQINNTRTGVATSAIAGFVAPTAGTTSAGVFGQVNGTVQGYGVSGFVNNDVNNSAGVFGSTQSGSNNIYGVRGTTSSTSATAAGVVGENGNAGAGVLGINIGTGPGGRFSAGSATGPAIVVPPGGGYLGIGVTNPAQAIDVLSTTQTNVRVKTSLATSSASFWAEADNGTQLVAIKQYGTTAPGSPELSSLPGGVNAGWSVLTNGSTGSGLIVKANAGPLLFGTAGNEIMRIDNTNQNIGIGMSAPPAGTRLYVQQTGGGSVAGTFFNNTAGATALVATTIDVAAATTIFNAASGGTQRFVVRGNGEISTPSIHNNGGTGGATAGAISSGTFTPSTAGSSALLGISFSAGAMKWQRVGNIVHVVISLNVTPTGAGTGNIILSLPTTMANFSDINAGSGVLISNVTTNISNAIVTANGGAQTLIATVQTFNTTTTNLRLSFQYEVQ